MRECFFALSSSGVGHGLTHLHATRSLRLLPHDQDTGGFFVCVLERVPKGSVKDEELASASGVKRAISPSATDGGESSKKVKIEEASNSLAPEEPIQVADEETDLPAPKGELKQGRADPQFKEDAFFFINPQDPELQSCM
jgi:multisite-specific tRNA:(cytosine-C5)-methyltransferase